MNKIHVVSSVACVSVFLATGAFAEILGVQPGTSKNPKDNVPTEIQRDDVSGGDTFPGGSGPGTRGNALTGGMEKEKSQPVTRLQLERNAEPGGGAAMAAEELKEKNKTAAKKEKKSKQRETGNDGPKKDPKMFQQESSANRVQSQTPIHERSQTRIHERPEDAD